MHPLITYLIAREHTRDMLARAGRIRPYQATVPASPAPWCRSADGSRPRDRALR
jgi:hypothetical protein